MPELIRAGHIYIAQPPLYKVARGRSEVYLKDNAALDQYLVDAGIGGLVLETAEGSRSGADLRTLVDHARRFRTLMTYRSEEHTSELQSLMRISYAVFCLKQKKNQQDHTDNDPIHTTNNSTTYTVTTTINNSQDYVF